MNEKILSNKKNGMLVLVLTILLMLFSVVLMVIGASQGTDDAPAPIF